MAHEDIRNIDDVFPKKREWPTWVVGLAALILWIIVIVLWIYGDPDTQMF